MLIVQNQFRPAQIQNALYDLMRPGVASVRVCSAYVTVSGSGLLLDGIQRSAPNGKHEEVEKTIVASLDFGITEPDALSMWMQTSNTQVFVAGADQVAQGTLLPKVAFHPKLYVFNGPDSSISALVGSANLTNRGLTINSEVAWVEQDHSAPKAIDSAWDAAVQPTTLLTDEILEAYHSLWRKVKREKPPEELEPVPTPELGTLTRYTPFAEAGLNPVDYSQMWVQSRGMQGGAGTQLELPRGSHQFFGATYEHSDATKVAHIAEPTLVSGLSSWHERHLTWHGDNKMERINLPSRAMGGFDYANSLILFRRLGNNVFELRVFPWDSDSARAYVEASRKAGLVLRVGKASNRVAGFLQ